MADWKKKFSHRGHKEKSQKSKVKSKNGSCGFFLLKTWKR